jgi:cyclophilin family peptidyl-prolyl cis-trans isomerase
VNRRGRPLALLLLLATVGVSIGACGGGGDSGKKEGAKAERAACQTATQPAPRRVRKRRPPSFRLSPAKKYTAVVETNCGEFSIALDAKNSPRTGGSFVTLVRKGFYDGLTFHRVILNYLIQGGDPSGDSRGGPGYKVVERPPEDTVYSEGVVAMGRKETDRPGTSGSQFFVVTATSAPLDPTYAVLGRVKDGLDVVHRIEAQPVDPNDRPLQPVVIDRIRIKER